MNSGERTILRDGWTFLSNHAHVVMCLDMDRDMRVRDVAARVGITERAVQHILADLERAAVVTRSRVGRRNRYELSRDAPLRHPLEEGLTIGHIVDLRGHLTTPSGDAATGR